MTIQNYFPFISPHLHSPPQKKSLNCNHTLENKFFNTTYDVSRPDLYIMLTLCSLIKLFPNMNVKMYKIKYFCAVSLSK